MNLIKIHITSTKKKKKRWSNDTQALTFQTDFQPGTRTKPKSPVTIVTSVGQEEILPPAVLSENSWLLHIHKDYWALTDTCTWNIFKGNQLKIINTGQAIKKKISKVTSIHTLFKKILHEKLLNLVTYDRHTNPNYKEGSLPVNLKGCHEKSTKNQWWKRHGENGVL